MDGAARALPNGQQTDESRLQADIRMNRNKHLQLITHNNRDWSGNINI